MPDSSGRVFSEPFTIAATNDLFRRQVWRFADGASATKDCLHFAFLVPQDYDTTGTTEFTVVWATSVITAGDSAVWDIDYRAVGGDDSESLDQASFQESLTVTDDVASAAWERLTPSLTATASNFSAGDEVQGQVCMDKSDAAHDLDPDDAFLFRLIFSYTSVAF
ncbi:MAG: hypothetical protein GWN87_00755 [Desulfuromonadales bacterium]|nr:hypothetical protein [Desulfuromonadales bacterium]